MSKPLSSLSVLGVLRHPALLRLWLAQIIYLSVQFTASYAMIVLITEETRSATLVGLVIIALSLPLVLFGAPAGALVDRMNRRNVLWISNVVRALATGLFVLALLLAPHQYYAIYLLAFFFSLVGLFFSPAEGAIIPQLVGESELLPALSLYNLTLNASQAVGLLILGPLALDLVPAIDIPLGTHHLTLLPVVTLFAGLTVLYLIAAALTASLPREGRLATSPKELLVESKVVSPQPEAQAADPPALPVGMWKSLRADVIEGWDLVRRDGLLIDGLWQSCFGGLVMLTVAELATTFVQRLLGLPVSDTALVFAPAGVGLLAGSLLVPLVVGRLGHTRTVVIGMFGAAIGIGLLPFAHNLTGSKDPSNLLAHPLFLLALAGLMILAGAAIDCIIVPAQTRMQERSPDALRGRVLAFYQVLFNGGAIPVILFMGALTDLLGIQTVILVLAALNVLAGLLTALRAVMRDRSDRSSGNSGDKRLATGSLLTSGKQPANDQRSLAGDRA